MLSYVPCLPNEGQSFVAATVMLILMINPNSEDASGSLYCGSDKNLKEVSGRVINVIMVAI